MTDIREYLADAIDKAMADNVLFAPIEIVDVLLSLPGITIVELPESDESRWPVGGKHAVVEAREGLVWVPFQDVYEWPTTEAYHPRYARRLAVAILAAVDAVEREAK